MYALKPSIRCSAECRLVSAVEETELVSLTLFCVLCGIKGFKPLNSVCVSGKNSHWTRIATYIRWFPWEYTFSYLVDIQLSLDEPCSKMIDDTDSNAYSQIFRTER